MATRKIRLTLSGTQLNGIGPMVDIDFNDENLDVDVDVTAITGTSTLVKEYTVDVAAGTYNLDITFKNDENGDTDRNLYIENIEIADNGIDYSQFIYTEANSTATNGTARWIRRPNPDYNESLPKDNNTNPKFVLNDDFDINQTRTDNSDLDYRPPGDPGSNSRYVYDLELGPCTIYKNSVNTFNITFV